MPSALRHIYTLLVVMIGFILFNAADLKEALTDIGGLVGIGGVPFVSAESLYYLRSYGLLFVVAFIGATPLLHNAHNRLSEKKVVAMLEPVLMIAALLLCSADLVDGSFNPFLYFRF